MTARLGAPDAPEQSGTPPARNRTKASTSCLRVMGGRVYFSPGQTAPAGTPAHRFPRMGPMSARIHVCVVLLLASITPAGCIFGGGGKKPEAKAAAPPANPAAVDETVATEGDPRAEQLVGRAPRRPDDVAAPAVRR